MTADCADQRFSACPPSWLHMFRSPPFTSRHPHRLNAGLPTMNNPRKRGLAPTAAAPSSSRPSNQTHDRKRLKLQDARSIAVQTVDPAFKCGQLDINTFVKSREFEIRALEDAINSSKRANSKRAFQSVPRSMRRRTASHNVKRVPKRLRSRHAKEMADDNTPTVTARRRKLTPHMRLRHKTGVETQAADKAVVENVLRAAPVPKSKFRKRQTCKTWLPTHVWHAKRASMVTRWRYAIAESPTEKCYRPTHRASTLRGALAWDQSYYATILLKGMEKEVCSVLRRILGDEDKGMVTGKGPVRRGMRSWRGWVYERDAYPIKSIAPVTILWARASPKPVNSEERLDTLNEDNKSKHIRHVLLRIHPASFFQLWMTVISVTKEYKSVTSEDLRFEIGSIEVTGPAATDVLIASLQPRVDPTDPESPEGVWGNLRCLTNPSALPKGAFLAFDILDPRLHFPPRLSPLSEEEEEISNRLFATLSAWPVDRTQLMASLFSREARLASTRAQSSQKRINKRKAEAMPGELPVVLPTDPYIPIILLANHHPTPLPSTQKGFSASASNAIGSWTLLLPWKWVLPVWYSIVHVPGVRFGGLVETRQIQYENGCGSFPDDFPGTKSGLEEEERKAALRKDAWDRKPKQKRIAWETVDLGEGRKGEVGRGLWCDWEYLLKEIAKEREAQATEQPVSASAAKAGEATSVSLSSSVPIEDQDGTSIPPPGQIPPPLPSLTTTAISSVPSQIFTSPFHSSCSPWTIPTSLPTDPFKPSLSNLSPETLGKALFSVKISYLHRGAPSEQARSHAKKDPLAHKLRAGWTQLLNSHESTASTDAPPGPAGNFKEIDLVSIRNIVPQHGYPAVPRELDLLGFGKGTGVAKLFYSRDWKVKGAVSRLCVVREAGETII
ncbi:ribonucleases P/MRP protein subunit POP1-domain-containing protein [Kalaharituber pfeilii]|nr:ribonucleases P/MRP protein subunit POP1-domain-containing protein [Kalaharituber pfeilii]